MSNELHELIKTGLIIDIISYIEKNPASITQEHTETKFPPIFFAAQQGNVSAFNILIQNGARIDGVIANKLTLMHLAAAGGSIEIMQYLNANGLSYDVQADNGDTPFKMGTPEVKDYLYSQLKEYIKKLEEDNKKLYFFREGQKEVIKKRNEQIKDKDNQINKLKSKLESNTIKTTQPSAVSPVFNQPEGFAPIFPSPSHIPLFALNKYTVLKPSVTAKPPQNIISLDVSTDDAETPEKPDHKRPRNEMGKP